ncbi:MAG: lactate racemase domain-containing protein [Spirochaetota bacterium]
MSAVDELLENVPLPRMARVRQKFPRPRIEDPAAAVRDSLARLGEISRLPGGSRIALAVGSRGIVQLPELVAAAAGFLKDKGFRPFIVPAMGSHGGATAEGQKDLLAHLGVTEQSAGVPIASSMAVREIGKSPAFGLPVYVDENALQADAIVILNRIKPHPAFRATYESGLVKMVAIGLGKQRQAEIVHNLGAERMGEYIEDLGLAAIGKLPLAAGIAVVENAYHEIALVEALPPERIGAREPELLAEARRLQARFILDKFDALVIDEIGKDISGAGFDTTIVGRYSSPYIKGGPRIGKVAVLDITDKSNGYGGGLGMVDFTTRRAADKFDPEQTYPNTLTSTFTEGIKIPMTLKNERQAIQACVKTCNTRTYEEAKVVRIRNTLCMDEILISENMLGLAEGRDDLEILGQPKAMEFDESGDLVDRNQH